MVTVLTEGETVTISWDEAASNGATVTYTVTVILDGVEVYDEMTQSNSVSVMRDQFQESDHALTDTDYEVVVLATNSVGSSDEVSDTFTIPSGTCRPIKGIN